MTAKEIMTPGCGFISSPGQTTIPADTHIIDTLHRLLDSANHRLDVVDGDECIGCITPDSLLAGLGAFLAPRDDSSMVVVECTPQNYSASSLAHAVEDADAHLVDLWSSPSDNGRLRVTLRVRRADPTPVVRSLERYGFDVVDSFSSSLPLQTEMALERIQALQAILNI